jgi:hypothetical protein
MRKVVVLPAPLGPSRPKISPCATSKEVLATAVKSPNAAYQIAHHDHRPVPAVRRSCGDDAGRFRRDDGRYRRPPRPRRLLLAQQHHEAVFEFPGSGW